MFSVLNHFVYWWFVSRYLGTLGKRLYFGSMGLIIHFIPISQWTKPQEVQCPLIQTQTQGAEIPPRLLVQRGAWAQGSSEGLWLGACVHVNVCACMHVHVCMHMCIIAYIYMYVVSVCMYAIYLHMCLHVHTCVYLWVLINVYVSMHVYVCTCICCIPGWDDGNNDSKNGKDAKILVLPQTTSFYLPLKPRSLNPATGIKQPLRGRRLAKHAASWRRLL